VPPKKEMIEKMEEYFAYRWKNDKNVAIDDEEELAILEQLPGHVQD